jgi:putative hydrolase of the HAD superfamily
MDGRRDVEAIVSAIATEYEASVDEVEQDVHAFLESLRVDGLLEWRVAPVPDATQASVTTAAIDLSGFSVWTFDLFHTLVRDADPKVTFQARCRTVQEVARAQGRQVDDATFEEAMRLAERERAKRVLDDGAHLYADAAVAMILSRCGVNPTPNAVAKVGNAFALRQPLLMPGAKRLLDLLRDQGKRIGIVSNLGFERGTLVRSYLDALGIRQLFDALAFSDEVGVYKPHGAIFTACLDRLGAAPAECVHVGDSVPSDVVGAQRLGIATIRFAGLKDEISTQAQADIVVMSFNELSDRVRR